MIKNKNVIFIVLGILALVLVWWLASPLIIDKEVNEQLPLGSSGSIEETVELEGSFVDADSFHKTSGTVKVTSIDGKRYLSFENFESTNGPDLYVYLATDTQANDFVNLGRLKGNIGNQNYEIGQDVNLSVYDNTLIWCKSFSVLFGSAELS